MAASQKSHRVALSPAVTETGRLKLAFKSDEALYTGHWTLTVALLGLRGQAHKASRSQRAYQARQGNQQRGERGLRSKASEVCPLQQKDKRRIGAELLQLVRTTNHAHTCQHTARTYNPNAAAMSLSLVENVCRNAGQALSNTKYSSEVW